MLNHAHYLKSIPLYRKQAEEGGYGQKADVEAIISGLMLDADVFKSYEQSWLDNGDYTAMTRWLSGIFHRRLKSDMSGVSTIDGWIERLAGDGVHVVYSSGTSGAFSFIPRELRDWDLSRTANISCLASLFVRRLKEALPPMMMRLVLRTGMGALARLAGKRGLPDFDAAFLGFRHGHMGNQVLIEELVPLFHQCYYLYDMTVTGSALRCARRGASSDEEHRLVMELQDEVSGRREEAYQRLIGDMRTSVDAGRKVFLFGAPYQFKELCDVAGTCGEELTLPTGSLIFFGGGWKTFAGEAIERSTLEELLQNVLGVPKEMVFEGYSMTEINMLMLRCPQGLFHIPPLIEAVVLDDELRPLRGTDVRGAFGFMDPLALSYPGFIVTSDHVHMVEEVCGCGLAGPAIKEIGRLPGSEVKGCGGIMGSMTA